MGELDREILLGRGGHPIFAAALGGQAAEEAAPDEESGPHHTGK
jgi:hypothetical protein